MVGPEAREGRGLVVFGSNHGNEYEGPMVISRLMRELKTADVIRAHYPRSNSEPGGLSGRHA